MQQAQEEPGRKRRQQRIGEDDAGSRQCRDDGGAMRTIGLDEFRCDEAAEENPQGLHGVVVADHLGRHAVALHDEREQREHQPEREAEYADRSDGGEQIDPALPIHGLACG